ncbi:hypothetical protein ACIRVK_39700 [Streptomyces sp. NPDC101152]|uniref:hypothetical protein n=1 Tax=Streptomyces sp. NPDC101152 TaxID=3366116 RepID=UPI00380F6A80
MATACAADTAIVRRDRALILLGFATAARRSELAALNTADVTDVDEGLQVVIRTHRPPDRRGGRRRRRPRRRPGQAHRRLGRRAGL